MIFLREKFKASPAYARVAPFVIFLSLTYAPLFLEGNSRFWCYLAKMLVCAWIIWEMRPFVLEMRWKFSWEAFIVGLLVFIMWVGIDAFYPHPKQSGPDWNPHVVFGQNSSVAWGLIVMRILGMTFVVPPIEEAFWRSFLYRWFVKTDFQNMPFHRFHLTSFVVTAALFGSEHFQWLAGILCGFAYQWLVIRKDRLGDAMTAHAITNFLLGVWVVWQGDWKFF